MIILVATDKIEKAVGVAVTSPTTPPCLISGNAAARFKRSAVRSASRNNLACSNGPQCQFARFLVGGDHPIGAGTQGSACGIARPSTSADDRQRALVRAKSDEGLGRPTIGWAAWKVAAITHRSASVSAPPRIARGALPPRRASRSLVALTFPASSPVPRHRLHDVARRQMVGATVAPAYQLESNWFCRNQLSGSTGARSWRQLR
ncbi:MAG: hypothetical protein KIT23_02140 [Sphingopyxis sp.]|nr:hypothetical protein [Sphingopyxis sp.]